MSKLIKIFKQLTLIEWIAIALVFTSAIIQTWFLYWLITSILSLL